MRIQTLIMALAVGSLIPMVLPAEEKQSITGQVLDADGKPVVGADVAISWSADTAKMHPFNGVQTDKEGRFSLPSQNAFGPAIMVLDKERKTGAVAMFKGNFPSPNVQLRPVVRVHGSIFCKELNKLPPWTTVSIFIDQHPFGANLVQFSPKAKEFSFLLPPGTYRLEAHGSGVEMLRKTLTLSQETPDLDLKVLNMEATVISLHVGKAPPVWKVTDARGAKKEVKLSDFKGKWVLVKFWGSPIAGSMSGLIDLYEAREKDRDKFEIIAFHDNTVKDFKELDEKLKKAKEMEWRGRDLPFPILLDSTGQTFKHFGIRHMGTSILIDPEGMLIGEAFEEQLEAKLPVLPMPDRLAKALDKNVAFYFDDPPLDQALRTLSDLARIPIRLDKEKLKSEGIATDAKMPLNINAQNRAMSLRSALNLLLDGLELGYGQDDKGIFVAPRKIGASQSNKLSEPQQASAKRIEKILDQKVTFNFQNKSLAQVATHFALTTRENFVLEPADRRAGLLDANASVTGSAENVSLREALESLLGPVRVGFVVREEAVVLRYKAQDR